MSEWRSPGYYENSVGMDVRTGSFTTTPEDNVLRFCWWTKDGGRIVRFVRSLVTSDWQDLAIEILKHPVKDKA